VVVASYSGKLLSFTSELVLSRAVEDTYGRNIKTVSNENRLKQLTKELDELKKKLDKERANVKKSLPSTVTAAGSAGSSGSAASSSGSSVEFPMNMKFILDKQTSAYVLSIEIQSAIDLVIIRSETVLDVVDSDIGNSVISITPPSLLEMNASSDVDTKNKFIAAFRCQGEERRMSITLQPFEGESGQVAVTVVTAAPKAAKLIKFALTPLSLHYRVHEVSEQEQSRPRHVLKFSGAMTIAVVYDWMLTILPDVPSYLSENVMEGVLFFKNALTGAVSVCRYMCNEIVFESESATTIVIFKENLTKLANMRRVQLDEHFMGNSRSIPSYLSLMSPKLEYQLSLTRRVDLLDSIREMSMQETDNPNARCCWLSAEYADILKNEQCIRKEAASRAKTIEYLTRLISDLFVNYKRLQGIDARSRLPDLKGVIVASNFDNLVAAFLQNDQQ
jgi:Bardet-Biedl syndrome 7 protein